MKYQSDDYESQLQLNPAIPEVKGPINFIYYWRIFIIAHGTFRHRKKI